jgi:hypothetical protein
VPPTSTPRKNGSWALDIEIIVWFVVIAMNPQGVTATNSRTALSKPLKYTLAASRVIAESVRR